jgi:hypothetical protein
LYGRSGTALLEVMARILEVGSQHHTVVSCRASRQTGFHDAASPLAHMHAATAIFKCHVLSDRLLSDQPPFVGCYQSGAAKWD